MKKLTKFSCLTAALLMVFTMGGCGLDSSLAGIQKHGKLVIATSANFPPYEDEVDGQIVGWDMDIAAEFAKALNVKLVIDNMDFDSVINSVVNNKAHIGMAGLSYSEERAKSVDFTQGVIDSSQVIIVRSDETRINSPFDLAGKVIAAQKGTVGEKLGLMDEDWAFVKGVAQLGAPSAAHGFKSGALAVAALLKPNHEVDAVIIDQYPAENFVRENAGKVRIVTKEDGVTYNAIIDDEYAFAVKKGSTELVDKLNSILNEMRADGRFQKLLDKHFGKTE